MAASRIGHHLRDASSWVWSTSARLRIVEVVVLVGLQAVALAQQLAHLRLGLRHVLAASGS